MPVMGIRELSRHVSDAMRRVEAGETVIVTRHGRPAAVILPLEAERIDALTLAAVPDLVRRTARAVSEMESGEGRSLDDLIAESEREVAGEATARK